MFFTGMECQSHRRWGWYEDQARRVDKNSNGKKRECRSGVGLWQTGA